MKGQKHIEDLADLMKLLRKEENPELQNHTFTVMEVIAHLLETHREELKLAIGNKDYQDWVKSLLRRN